MAATLRHGLKPVLALFAAVLVLFVAAPAAHADPEDEGGSKKLRTQLESASKGFSQAKLKLAASKKRQTQLKATEKAAQDKEAALRGRVQEIAARSYMQGRFSTMSLLLNASSPDGFMERSRSLDQLGQIDGQVLKGYSAAADTAAKASKAIALEIKEQQKQVTVMGKKKEQAEAALASVGGGESSGGFVGADSPNAKPAPRNGDGSWPREGCTVNDPTSSGCLTPRTLNAYQQAQAAGYKRYTVCFSERASGEHPKGRACDFSAAAGGFEDVAASGGDKTYGNNLAAYFVNNADRLGVLYVIWYREIWMPSTGWRAYSASGGPSVVHTNHVHLSME